jgi:hypothetical protein
MLKRIPRPSPGLVIASLALFAALAGVAGALPGKNTVNSGDVKKDALKGKDIKESTLKLPAAAVTGEKVAANSLTGADINYGSHVVTANNPEGADGAEASCPAGQIATGGGADSADPADTGALLTSIPEPNTGQAIRWQVFYESTANAGDITAYAICMPA